MSGFIVDLTGGSSSVSDADASTKGILKLTNDLSGSAALPTIVSLTGSGGIITTSAQITQSTLTNNTATVYKGEFLRISKTISLIQVGTGNFDTTVWQSPTRFRLIGMALRFASTVTYGTLGASILSLGTAAGGTQLMAAYTLLGTETTSTVPVGNALTQLGTDLPSTSNYQKMYMAATTFSFRNAVSAGSITAGSVEVELLGYQF